MGNLVIERLTDGNVRITAKEGYRLYAVNAMMYIYEAIVPEKQISNFKAIKKV